MKDIVKVSVIIPNYNRANLVGHAIENMLLQSLPPHEVIVIDDGSTDNSVSVIKSFGNRVKVIVQENRGPGAARNSGLRIATGNFIQLMDSDDLASLNKLEVQAKVMQEKNADLVYGPWVKVDINGKDIKLQDVVLQLKPIPGTRDPLLWFLTDWSMVFQQCLLRKSVLEKVGGYREDIRYLEDGDLFVRLMLKGISIEHEKDSLTLYRMGDFEKLTGNYKLNERRAIDQGMYYESLLKFSASSLLLNNHLKHYAFKLRLNEAIRDLKKHHAGNLSTAEISFDRLAVDSNYYALIGWFRNKLNGLKHKIIGHRWHAAYGYGNLTDDKRNLIQSLGFHITER